ncbi:MAG: hypothetical protein J1E83_12790 [Lachnospiraceae bacterium]|nr:hypothetical protein [Lachnospiraceae bacterium]
MSNLEIYEKVRSVPSSAQRKIESGRLKGKTDINPMWRIKALTEQFGPCGVGWYYKTTKQWTEQIGEEIAAFVNIELFIKYNDEWSQPIFGVGGSMLAAKESKGIHVSDECFKMATTDAISVACKQLGIGADVYWEKDKTKYGTDEDEVINAADMKRLEPVFNQLKRTGYSQNAICKTYKIDNIFTMSDLQIKDFLEKIKSVPDKENT